MSVTFYLGRYVEDEQFGTILAPLADHTHSRPETCCEDAALYFGQCNHAEADEAACGCREHEVNVSNANAVAILERLGYDTDPECPAGEATGDDLLGRAVTGNIGHDDSGTPATVDGGPGTGHCTWVDCGVDAGYFTRTLERLAELATAAQNAGAMVVWA